MNKDNRQGHEDNEKDNEDSKEDRDTVNLKASYGPGNCCQIKPSYASHFNPNTILLMKGNYFLICKILILKYNHPWITLF